MISNEQIGQFRRDGFVMLPGLFDETELKVIDDALPAVFGEEGPHRILESGTGAVRGVHGVHETHPLFNALVRLPRLLEPARQLLNEEVYIHQFKINAKMALVGEVWEWHQDFRFWRDEDGMPTSKVLTAAIFMDRVDEFNGPLMLVPGSHHNGVLDTTSQANSEWSDTLAAKLKYTITPEALGRAVGDRGIVAPKGEAGSVLLFDGNILHGSAQNMSPRNRRIVLVTYNAMSNRLHAVANPRPEFVASRTFEPVTPVSDSALTDVLTGASHA